MNKVGIYYAYWTRDWDADFIPYLFKAKELGFDVLEVNAGTVATMNSKEQANLKSAAADAGISMSCCIGLPSTSDMASSDPDIRKSGLNHLNSIADAMVQCGITRLGGIIYSCWPAKLDGRHSTKTQAWDWSVATMKEAIRKAEDHGLTYNVEVVNRFEQFLLNTAEEGVNYAKAVGSPSLKVLLDTFHMNIEENSISEAIELAGNYLGHFHIGENNRKPPGTGTIPWKKIINSLEKIRYEGWVVMEPFLKPGGEVGRDISVFRDIMPKIDLDEEAEKSCNFIKQLLK